jgi:hypothetical protein
LNQVITYAGLVLVVLSAGLLIFFSLTRKKNRGLSFRSLPAFQRLRRFIGLSVEQGTRLHVTVGSASLVQPSAASGLVGLKTLERVAEISSISDRPPVATSGDGALALLAKDSVHAAYRQNNALDQFEPDRAFLSGPTPFSYAVGTIPMVADEHVSANLMVGHFGPEIALVVQAAEQKNQFSLAGSDALPAQAILYASAQEPLIGEETFAVPAYLQAGPAYEGSLLTQDVLRWILIGGMLVGSILAFLKLV